MDAPASGHQEVVLMVCRANLIRSPLAAGLLRRRLLALGRDDLVVSSGGLEVVSGSAPGAEVLQVALEHHVSLDAHRPRPVTVESLQESALVVTMTETQRTGVCRMSRAALARTFTLLELVRLLGALDEPPATTWSQLARRAHVARPLVSAASQAEDVPDPIGRPVDHLRSVADTLADLTHLLGSHVASRAATR